MIRANHAFRATAKIVQDPVYHSRDAYILFIKSPDEFAWTRNYAPRTVLGGRIGNLEMDA